MDNCGLEVVNCKDFATYCNLLIVLVNGANLVSKLGLEWSEVKYCLHDLPFSEEQYQQRRLQLKNMSLPQHACSIESILCTGPDHLEQILELTLDEGAEGLLAMEPHSMYTIGPTSTVLTIGVNHIFLY